MYCKSEMALKNLVTRPVYFATSSKRSFVVSVGILISLMLQPAACRINPASSSCVDSRVFQIKRNVNPHDVPEYIPPCAPCSCNDSRTDCTLRWVFRNGGANVTKMLNGFILWNSTSDPFGDYQCLNENNEIQQEVLIYPEGNGDCPLCLNTTLCRNTSGVYLDNVSKLFDKSLIDSGCELRENGIIITDDLQEGNRYQLLEGNHTYDIQCLLRSPKCNEHITIFHSISKMRLLNAMQCFMNENNTAVNPTTVTTSPALSSLSSSSMAAYNPLPPSTTPTMPNNTSGGSNVAIIVIIAAVVFFVLDAAAGVAVLFLHNDPLFAFYLYHFIMLINCCRRCNNNHYTGHNGTTGTSDNTVPCPRDGNDNCHCNSGNVEDQGHCNPGNVEHQSENITRQHAVDAQNSNGPGNQLNDRQVRQATLERLETAV